MPYTALPDRRIPYDNDGTVCAYGPQTNSGAAVAFAGGLTNYYVQSDLAELNDSDYGDLPTAGNGPVQIADGGGSGGGRQRPVWMFFPEQREVTAMSLGF